MIGGPPGRESDLSPEHRALLSEVREFKEQAEYHRRPHIDNWNRWYGLHRGYVATRENYRNATSESDRDEVINNARREFGAELHIPFVYAMIETIIPRVLMNDPLMKGKPKPSLPDKAAPNLEATKHLFEERQAQINYSLRLHPTARRGFKYGLGIQKTYWDRCTRKRVSIERGLLGFPVKREREEVVSEGPMVEDCDVFDCFWPGYAKDMETCDRFLHRTWRPFSYIKRKVESGEWLEVDLEAVKGMGSSGDRDTAWAERMKAAGMTGFDKRGSQLHEVWEYHDGERVVTVLNKQLIVQDKPNPFYHRELPFQIFRPTIMEGEFVGMSEIDPIEHLQYELNTLRSQRRDNATLVLQKSFIYAEGMVEPENLVVGPGMGIPVYGDPSQVIRPIDFGEIPSSGYEEETAIKSDLEFATGISESVAGGSAGEQTATSTQLVQQAANVRIQLKAKMLHLETLRPAAAQWLELYRQHTTQAPRSVMVETPEGYDQHDVAPDDLWGIEAMLPEAGSTEPENRAQEVNDALAIFNQVNGNPVIDQRKAMSWLLKQLRVPDGESWIVPEQTVLNPQVAMVVGHAVKNALMRNGIEEADAEDVAEEALDEAMQTAGVGAEPGPPMSQNRSQPASQEA